MARLQAYDLTVNAPSGWDAQIYQRPAEPLGVVGLSMGAALETPLPILHLANFALPAQRGDYGGGALDTMRAGGVFISILQHHPRDAASALFKGRPKAWPVKPDQFDPNAMQRRVEHQAGLQAFFVAAGRPYCLYVVIGGYALRRALAGVVNEALATVSFS